MQRTRQTMAGSIIALIAVLALGAAGAAAEGAPALGAPGSTLRVGIAPNYPPLAFKQDGNITGVEADFAERLGKALDLKITLVETPWEDLIPALQQDKVDVIMSGYSITPAREKLVAFTNSYAKVSQMALYRAGDQAHVRKLVKGNSHALRIGVVSGTTGEQYAHKNHSHAQIQGFDSVDAGVAALRKGDIDVFVHDSPAIWRVTGGFGSPERELAGYYEPLTEEHLAWAVRKKDTHLRTQLNGVLAKWKADGTIESVLDHWIPVRKEIIRPLPKS